MEPRREPSNGAPIVSTTGRARRCGVDRRLAKRHATVLLAAFGIACGPSPSPSTSPPPPPPAPNFLFILADDLGWMDVGAYGSRYYETPNLDRLARSGVRFTDAYTAAPVCTPTRAAILTGLYPARFGITTAAGAVPPRAADAPIYPERAVPGLRWLAPHSKTFLPPEASTTAEALQKLGYRSAHIGKWHLGRSPEHWADRQGFDVVFAGAPDAGPTSYFSPYGFDAGTIVDGPQGEYITDRLTDEAIGFIEDNRDRPFFLNLWHFAVHGPWGYKEALRERYAGRADPLGRQDNPVMAAMIQSLDEGVGRILDRLDELGLTERTVVVFTSDNGGHATRGPEMGGRLVTNNAPLRGGKSTLYEGGIRTPLIVSWPGVIEGGTTSAELVTSVDFFPTLLELANAGGGGAGGGEGEPEPVPVPVPVRSDGVSLASLLLRGRPLPRREIYAYHPNTGGAVLPGVAVRRDNLKLIRWFGTNPWYPESLELYDLENDIGERRNLAGDLPTDAAALDALIERFLADAVASPPILNPVNDPERTALGRWRWGGPGTIEGGLLRLALSGLRKDVWQGPELRLFAHPDEAGLSIGPHRLTLRARAEATTRGRLRVESAPPDVDADVAGAGGGGPGEASQRTFMLSGDGDAWETLSFDFPMGIAPIAIALEFLTNGSDVAIDRVEIDALEKGLGVWPTFRERLVWEFELAPP